MCYFDHQLWPCGWWRWGHFRGQCPKEYRTGETCGLKLVYNTYLEPEVCLKCDTIHKKQRRVAKMLEDVKRWTCEGNRRATIEKTQLEICDLNDQINELWREHEIRKTSIAY
ncbi:hypothetical protein C8A00DRAFT_12491 [Chaetomidium leptoderma]|uniref:Uncharacterized protein n=1 Tax=Chaetomidium leptoderma TaxID=669021 RepID=A0AAN6VS00_9PEZI|nr:hypothetical protein C8A00DRAFT_12491 [Chaetomidium leptoderma]